MILVYPNSSTYSPIKVSLCSNPRKNSLTLPPMHKICGSEVLDLCTSLVWLCKGVYNFKKREQSEKEMRGLQYACTIWFSVQTIFHISGRSAKQTNPRGLKVQPFGWVAFLYQQLQPKHLFWRRKKNCLTMKNLQLWRFWIHCATSANRKSYSAFLNSEVSNLFASCSRNHNKPRISLITSVPKRIVIRDSIVVVRHTRITNNVPCNYV